METKFKIWAFIPGMLYDEATQGFHPRHVVWWGDSGLSSQACCMMRQLLYDEAGLSSQACCMMRRLGAFIPGMLYDEATRGFHPRHVVWWGDSGLSSHACCMMRRLRAFIPGMLYDEATQGFHPRHVVWWGDSGLSSQACCMMRRLGAFIPGMLYDEATRGFHPRHVVWWGDSGLSPLGVSVERWLVSWTVDRQVFGFSQSVNVLVLAGWQKHCKQCPTGSVRVISPKTRCQTARCLMTLGPSTEHQSGTRPDVARSRLDFRIGKIRLDLSQIGWGSCCL